MENWIEEGLDLTTPMSSFFDNASNYKYYSDGSQEVERHNSAFPVILHKLLEDAPIFGFDHIVSWLPCGDIFKVHDRTAFEDQIMGKYFKNQTKYKSFLRQLNLYGFKRAMKGQQRGFLSHDRFKREKPSLCQSIQRISKARNASTCALRHIEETSTPSHGSQVNLCCSRVSSAFNFEAEIASEIIATFCRDNF